MLAILAPAAPPCFGARDVWVGYCASAAVAQRKPDQPGPLRAVTIAIVDITSVPDPGVPSLVQDGMLYTFNTEFDFCGECEIAFRARMQRDERCDPKFLKGKP